MSSSLSHLIAHFWVFRLFMKGKFNAHVSWPLAKRVQNWIVDPSTPPNFMVCQNDTQSASSPSELGYIGYTVIKRDFFFIGDLSIYSGIHAFLGLGIFPFYWNSKVMLLKPVNQIGRKSSIYIFGYFHLHGWD